MAGYQDEYTARKQRLAKQKADAYAKGADIAEALRTEFAGGALEEWIAEPVTYGDNPVQAVLLKRKGPSETRRLTVEMWYEEGYGSRAAKVEFQFRSPAERDSDGGYRTQIMETGSYPYTRLTIGCSPDKTAQQMAREIARRLLTDEHVALWARKATAIERNERREATRRAVLAELVSAGQRALGHAQPADALAVGGEFDINTSRYPEQATWRKAVDEGGMGVRLEFGVSMPFYSQDDPTVGDEVRVNLTLEHLPVELARHIMEMVFEREWALRRLQQQEAAAQKA